MLMNISLGEIFLPCDVDLTSLESWARWLRRTDLGGNSKGGRKLLVRGLGREHNIKVDVN